VNIFVGNLSFSAKEEDVYKAFADFGAVANVAIVMEKKGKKSRGFGFVDMPVEQEALSAIAALNGKEILGRPVNVMVALPKKPGTEHPAKKIFSQPQTIAGSQQEPSFRRTGRYKQGRRSISYTKKRIAVGITTPVAERKYKPNPMRWRKKPRWSSSSQRSLGELNSGERIESSQSKPWKRAQGMAKPWRKSSSLQHPHSRRGGVARGKK
jgi:RNA recognition motif-containing protein